MAFLARKPFGQAPGLSLNVFFIETICLSMGYSWQFALTAVMIEGLIFILLTITGLRQYIVNAINEGWAVRWREKGWMRNKKDPALNPDLWGELLDLLEVHQVTFHWVKGHASNPYNNRCDELAVMESRKYKK